MTAVDDLIFQLNQNRTAELTQPIVADVDNVIAALLQLQAGSIPGSGLPQASQGRITTITGTPVLSTIQAGQTTVFFTPYNGNRVLLWTGSDFAAVVFTEMSQTLADATKSPAATVANANYDMFVWNDAGVTRCTRGPAWASTIARAAGGGLTRVKGIWTNTTNIVNGPLAGFGTHVGTIHTSAANSVDFQIGGGGTSGGDSSRIGLWNTYNRIRCTIKNIDIGDTWTYATPLVYRVKDNSAPNGITFVIGIAEDMVEAINTAIGTANAGGALECSIGLDGVVPFGGAGDGNISNATGARMPTAGFATNRADTIVSEYRGYPGIGFHTLFPLETGQVGGTWVGDDGASIVLSTFLVTIMY
jgi:hypothetical protein